MGKILQFVIDYSHHPELRAKQFDFSMVTKEAPKQRKEKFDQLRADVSNGYSDFADVIAKWENLDSRLDVFLFAFTVERKKWEGTVEKYDREVARLMPKDGTQSWSLRAEEIRNLWDGFGDMDSASHRIMSYVDDYQREMQRILLSEIFGEQLVKRITKPTIGAEITITLEDYEKVRAYFKAEESRLQLSPSSV